MISDEKFFAWLDGELAGEEADTVAAYVAADPALQARASAHRGLTARLRVAFAPVAEAPVPEGLSGLITEGGEVIDFAAARAKRRSVVIAWPRWGALAASLCVGVIGGAFLRVPDAAIVRANGGQLVASASLGKALDTQLASAQGKGDAVHIGLTYRTADGAICRSFAASAANGVACRGKDAWQVRGLFAPDNAVKGDYRMATGDQQVAALVDATIAGEPFDATAEKAARDAGWRGR